MTTHLVIADVLTLNRLLWAASGRLMVVDDPAVLLGGWLPWVHRETGDTWLFRTPESNPDPMDGKAHRVYGLRVDFRYVQDPGCIAYLWTVIDNPDPWGSVLPLIAACELLGVDEL